MINLTALPTVLGLSKLILVILSIDLILTDPGPLLKMILTNQRLNNENSLLVCYHVDGQCWGAEAFCRFAPRAQAFENLKTNFN